MSELTQSSHSDDVRDDARPTRTPTIRVAGLLVVDDRLLLVRQQRLGRSYWLLPGGGVRFGEPFAEALERELSEELGLGVSAGRPLALVESVSDDMSAYTKHVVHVILSMGAPGQGPETPSVAADPAILEPRWVDRQEVAALDLRPPIADFLVRCLAGLPQDVVYLGRRW